jgi:hypothetical protein
VRCADSGGGSGSATGADCGAGIICASTIITITGGNHTGGIGHDGGGSAKRQHHTTKTWCCLFPIPAERRTAAAVPGLGAWLRGREAHQCIGIDISQQRSKQLDAFADQSFDYIITVCDRVREVCPLFPNDPERIHWSFPDPAAIEDAAARDWAFQQTARQLMTRICQLITLIDRDRRSDREYHT